MEVTIDFEELLNNLTTGNLYNAFWIILERGERELLINMKKQVEVRLTELGPKPITGPFDD